MRSRWAVLAAGTVVQASQAAAVSGLAVLAPVLRDRYDLSLTQIGVLLGGSGIGAVLTLLPWGLAADGLGERVTATVGALGAAAGLAGAAYAPEFVSLVVLLSIAGALGASANTATARAVTSWFPRWASRPLPTTGARAQRWSRSPRPRSWPRSSPSCS